MQKKCKKKCKKNAKKMQKNAINSEGANINYKVISKQIQLGGT